MYCGWQGLFGRVTNRLREEFTVSNCCDSTTENGGKRAKEDHRLLSIDFPHERPSGKAFKNTKQLVEVDQDICRAGRDRNLALALLVNNSYHLRKVEQEVKDVCNSQTCRSKILLKPFVKESKLTIKDPHHMCCDRCMLLCKCDDCHKDTFALEKMIKDEPSVLDFDTDGNSTEVYNDTEHLIESDTDIDYSIMHAFKFEHYQIKLVHECKCSSSCFLVL